MSLVLLDDTTLTEIADALRSKTGNTDILYKPSNMGAAIKSIDTDGLTSTEFISLLNREIEELNIPNECTTIGYYAFAGCYKLHLTALPDSLTYIGKAAFNGCSKLDLNTLPNNLTYIEDYAFHNCLKLALTVLPNGLTFIGNYAFYNCSSLTLTALPDSLTYIGAHSFEWCESLNISSLPIGINTIQTMTFMNCTNLKTMDLPSVTAIWTDAFRGCSNLDTVILRSETMCTAEENVFLSTPIADGTGYIYVLSSLLESYKVADNWLTYAEQFRAIEDYPDICGIVSE